MRSIVLSITILSACFLQQVSSTHLRSVQGKETADTRAASNPTVIEQQAEAAEKDAWNAYEKKKVAYEQLFENRANKAKKPASQTAFEKFEKKFEENKAIFAKKVAVEKIQAPNHAVAEKASTEQTAEIPTFQLMESSAESNAVQKFEKNMKALDEAKDAQKKSSEMVAAAKVAADASKTELTSKLRNIAAAATAAANKAAIEKAEKAVMEKTAKEAADKQNEALIRAEAEMKNIAEKEAAAKNAAEKARAELAAAESAKASSAAKAEAQAEKAQVAKANLERYSSQL